RRNGSKGRHSDSLPDAALHLSRDLSGHPRACGDPVGRGHGEYAAMSSLKREIPIRRSAGGRTDAGARRAAAAIELAATLPLLVVLFLGACDFGRFGHVHSAVVNAARAGAGQGILNRPTPTTQ